MKPAAEPASYLIPTSRHHFRMMEDSPKKPLEGMPFSYRQYKNGTISISYENKEITTLKNKAAIKFSLAIQDSTDMEAQMIMAKITGNFKHGNERDGKKKAR